MLVFEPALKGTAQMEITTIGIDIAKSVFQFHGVDAAGQTVLQKKLRRNAVLDTLAQLPPCLIGMEACATSHHWAREISALGHDVRLIPPAYVKPYVKRQKNDAADAEAICEAVTRPNMYYPADDACIAERAFCGHKKCRSAGGHDAAQGP
jgi:transposase